MSTQVQYRRGTAAQNDAFTGALAEITVDTTNKTLRVFDGINAGGSMLVPHIGAANIIPAGNLVNSLGNSTNKWASLYVGGNTIYLGNLQLKEASANTFAVYTSDGITQANIDAGSIDVSAISSGTSSIGISGAGGNAYLTVGGTANVLVAATTGVYVTGIISASGNITGANIRGVNIDSTSADVAERYLADADYPVGTVLVIGGDQELTQSTGYAQTTVVGTVSEQPALTMNRDLQGKHVVSLAFLGRVPCRVVGNINRGDMLVSSNTQGVATAMESYVPGAVLGKALESYNSTAPGVIEIIVGRL